jgi:hypothetical protein
MAKAIIKEIFIMLLLCVAIVLVFGVIFYDYIPTNKAVPNKLEAYVTPENIQEEIDEEIMEMNKVEVSYEITESDLDMYKQTHSYTPGKRDPFSASTDYTNNAGGNNTGNAGNNGGTSGTNTDPNSTQGFFNETGLK